MPVHVSELLTELHWEDDHESRGSADAAPAEGTPAPLDRVRAAHERLIRDRLRTRAEDFSD